MLKTIAKKMIKDPQRAKMVMDRSLGDFYPERMSARNIIKHRTFFPMWDFCEIEIHSFCNRDCDFCPRYMDRSGVRKTQDGRQVRKKMPSQKVYDLLDELKTTGYKGSVRFGRLSEALLDQRYVEFARYAKSKGLSVREPTNGDVLRNDPELCERLDGLVGKLIVGIYDCKDDNEIDEQKEWFRQRFKKTEVGFRIPSKACVLRQGARVYAEHAAKQRDWLLWPCISLDKGKLLIRYDGEVSLCCEDDTSSFKLGNVFSQSISEIWWSARHRKIVSDVKKRGGRLKYKRCSRCYADMEGLDLS